jgi:serine phosphatase RsbU (regulator of sigma subunit)
MSLLHRHLILKFAIIEVIALMIGLGISLLIPSYAWTAIIEIGLVNIVVFYLIISRPFSRILREFKALVTGKRYNRIYTKRTDEIGVIAHFFNEITRNLERVSTDIKKNRRLSSELNVARQIQKDLLPQSNPDIKGLDIIAKTKPAAEIGGDSFDFIKKGDHTFMYIGDVTGHGVPSGLVMMIVDTLIHTFSDMVENSKQLLVQVNKYLKPRIQSTMFMTMIMLRWDEKYQKMYFSGAGHETIIHFNAQTKEATHIKSGGIALGMVPNNEALTQEKELPLNEGDYIVLYTDGIPEARNIEGELFGMETLLKIIEKNAGKANGAETLFQRIATEVTHFMKDHIQDDDMTLMVIRKGQKIVTESEKNQESTKWETKDEENSTNSLLNYNQEEEPKKPEESGLSQT